MSLSYLFGNESSSTGVAFDSSTGMSNFTYSSSTGSEETADEKTAFIAATTCAAAFVLILAIALGYLLKRRRLYWLPESVLSIAIGALSGALILLFRPHDVEKLIFDPQIFFFILLFISVQKHFLSLF